MGPESYEHIVYQVERNRARITLNRPMKLNAITNTMERELYDALWRADEDTSVHVVVLRGAGRAFCSGYDLELYGDPHAARGVGRGRDNFDDNVAHLERSQRYLRAFADIHKPVIAQVHGYCLAGGTGLALFCDMVIATHDCVFGFPAGRAGTLPNQMWMYHAGPQWTKRLLLTGDSVSGKDAATIGLVLKSVPDHLLEAEVEGLADRFARIDTDILSAGKRICNLTLELMGSDTVQRLAAEMDARAHLSQGTQEFYRAVQEKGLRNAFRHRDRAFGDGMARVDEPEIRDAEVNFAPQDREQHAQP